MRDGLKIYACSGLCNSIGTAPQDFQYWRDDTLTTNNTRAVNSLLADINLLEAQLQYKRDLTDEEVLSALNQIDLYVVCLLFAQQYNKDELPLAGRVIAGMIQEGMFDSRSLDDAERDEHLVSLCRTAEERFTAGDDSGINNDFTAWFAAEVTAQSYCGLSNEQRQRSEEFFRKQSGVGATGDQDAGQYLFNTGEYYLYLYMTREQAYKKSYIVGRKWDKQKEMYQYVHKCYDPIYGNSASVDKVIYIGICKQLGYTPEFVIEELTGYKSKGIGQVAEIIGAVASLIGVIITAISIILQYTAAALAVKYQAPTAADSGTPEDTEWEDPGKGKLTSSMRWGILAAGLALLYAAFSTKKNKSGSKN